VLEDEGCVRLDGYLVSDSPDAARATFGFGSASSVGGVAPAITLAGTGDDSVVVTSQGTVGSPFAETIGAAPAERIPFTLVIGSRAAVLVIDGSIVGAVATNGGNAVTVESANDGTRIEHLVRSAPPPGSGCQTSS
jgi:hypothetical protein